MHEDHEIVMEISGNILVICMEALQSNVETLQSVI